MKMYPLLNQVQRHESNVGPVRRYVTIFIYNADWTMH